MIPWKRRKVQAAAYAWRREAESSIIARIRIEQAILQSLRTELADLRQLEGEALAVRHGWESKAAIEETFRPKRKFLERITDLFVEANLAR